MLPVVTIIGRPNVGKSTLFNRLTKSNSALVVDLPGTTRDRNYGFGVIGDQKYIVIDTAGIDYHVDQNDLITNQVEKAIVESQIVLFVVDARDSLLPEDLDLAKKLRKFSKKIILVINKIDGINIDVVGVDFFRLGFNNVMHISAKANRGINQLNDSIIQEVNNTCCNDLLPISDYKDHIKVAIVGQPNVGKSTLVNSILGEDRVVVFDSPGTTRDSIYIPTQIGQYKYVIIDTAGVRKKSRVKETIEKFSVIKTMEAIENAQIVILLIDAYKGVVEQDLKLVECILNAGRSLVIAINKWDMISKEDQKKLKNSIKKELHFIDFITSIPISALHATGLKRIFREVVSVFKSVNIVVPTNKLTLLLQQAIQENQPPLNKGRRIKMRYAHLGGRSPFKIIIHGNQVESLPLHYKKYLASFFREKLQLRGTIVHIILKNSDNPYV